MKFDDIVDARHSVRKFKTKKPDWRKIVEAIDCARKGPLAGNIPALKFILVEKPEVIAKLAECSQQDFIVDAHYVIVVVADTNEVERSYDDRGKMYAHQQAGAAIQTIYLKLTELGLGTCWVGSFVDDQVKLALKIPDGSDPIVILPVGHPMLKGKKKRKPGIDRVLRFNDYKEKSMKPKKRIEGF
ncbi:hypothetical protein CMI46_02900 [Candidatus Pacearchaeota archaeon]|nr:hypothetical protein [Candidatus Pacearchaeota archaeon]|tara:strand:+ start:4971 stop:5528 length:558 start_codon:yes stop_codon:yes gene_type:complete